MLVADHQALMMLCGVPILTPAGLNRARCRCYPGSIYTLTCSLDIGTLLGGACVSAIIKERVVMCVLVVPGALVGDMQGPWVMPIRGGGRAVSGARPRA